MSREEKSTTLHGDENMDEIKIERYRATPTFRDELKPVKRRPVRRLMETAFKHIKEENLPIPDKTFPRDDSVS